MNMNIKKNVVLNLKSYNSTKQVKYDKRHNRLFRLGFLRQYYMII